jgi:signal transduction histidine kinase
VATTLAASGPALRVIDRGTGSAPEAMHRIFEPLAPAESQNTRTHPGVGLGHTLARRSANAMEGDVVLESTGSEGSTFLWTVTRPAT